jgi:hypothetical protein
MSDIAHVLWMDGGDGGEMLSGGRRGEVRRGECGATGGPSSSSVTVVGISSRVFISTDRCNPKKCIFLFLA